MNFKILTVNGQDLSGASHEEAAVALEHAPEPITVVLARSGGKKSPADSPNSSSQSRTEESEKISISTQTRNETCFCRFLLKNNQDISDPLSASIISELMRYRDSQANTESYDVNDAEVHHDHFSHEDEYCNIDCEEITLKRPSGEEKLGIVLFDHTDPFTNQVKVIVTDVAPDSIAAQCLKIQEGDQILKIDGETINCMNDASRLLDNNNQSTSFLIGHPRTTDQDEWLDEDKALFVDGADNDDVLCDVTNRMQSPTNRLTSGELRSKCHEHQPEKNLPKYAAMASPKIPCGSNGTTESAFHSSTGSSSQTGKDSGIGRTLDSSIQSGFDNCSRTISSDVRVFGTGSSQESKNSHAVAREFTYIQAQKYRFKKHEASSKHKLTAEASTQFAKETVKKFAANRSNTEFQKLSDAIQNIELENNKKNPRVCQNSSAEVFVDEVEDAMSPWVRIARQEYEEKLRQVEKSLDLRNIHPAMASSNVANFETVMAAMSSSRTPSDATDNTSSAYSTGESFRSSSTTSASYVGNELTSQPLSPGQKDQKPKPQRCGSTMTYYMSSDANSDGEGPACYLTHAEDSESEGFEDAGVEFSSTFHPETSETYRPVPLPRLLHPPSESVNFMSHSLTASTKQLWKAAAAVARNRRQPNAMQEPHRHENFNQTKEAKRNCQNRHRPCSRSTTTSSKERSESETIVPTNCQHSGEETTPTKVIDESDTHLNRSFLDATETKLAQCADNFTGPKVRRSSEHGRSNKKHAHVQRSASCNNPPEFGKQKNIQTDDKANDDVKMEWKVRVSRDGTRYITKRPVREKVLRHREKRILAERCGVTTDDDVTELKLGRHWSRDDRKRHLRHAREKKRRRDFMQQCRLEVLNENPSADGDIVELCHKKMTKQKHKRMLLDNFVTVQEILAHGDRSSDISKLNPLLSVTYI